MLSRDYPVGVPLGTRITASGGPGSPSLTVVGIATSITQSTDGWVLPGEIAALCAPGAPATAQMLYRFSSAGSAAAVSADAAALGRALRAGAVTATQSYLAVRLQQDSGIAPTVPFIVAFGVIGLVLSVLIVVNVVGGAVAAGYRRIGVLKSIGFTPGQVVAAYAGQVLVPAPAGCLAGVAGGAVLLGAITVTFAAGLAASLSKVAYGPARAAALTPAAVPGAGDRAGHGTATVMPAPRFGVPS